MSKATRSKARHIGTVIALNTPPRRPRDLRLPVNASPDQKIAYYHKVFKDPPNADQLMRRIAGAVNSDDQSRSEQVSSPPTGSFRLLQLTEKGTHVENIFKAMIYLRDAVREKARLEDESFVFNRSMHSPVFKEMAVELGLIELSLRGVTAQALHSLYERMIKERTELNEYLMVATGDKRVDTHLSLIAQELVDVDSEIREREINQKKAIDSVAHQKTSEKKAVEERGLGAMFGHPNPPNPQKRPATAGDLDADEQETEEEEANELAIHEPMMVAASPSKFDSTIGTGGRPSNIVSASTVGSVRPSPLASPSLPSASELTNTGTLSSACHTPPPPLPNFVRPPSSKYKRRAVSSFADDKIEALDLRMSKIENTTIQLGKQLDQSASQLSQQMKELTDRSTTHAKLNEVDRRLGTLIRHLMQEVAQLRDEMVEIHMKVASHK